MTRAARRFVGPVTFQALSGRKVYTSPWPDESSGEIQHLKLSETADLIVVAPATPYDAKGSLIHAIRDNDPVMFVEHRLLHFQKGPVPEDLYEVSPGKARVTAVGGDITLVGMDRSA